jgi:hypothetical protein
MSGMLVYVQRPSRSAPDEVPGPQLSACLSGAAAVRSALAMMSAVVDFS